MAMTISGDGSITGLTAGGLPDATITQSDLASPIYSKGTPTYSAYGSGATTLSNNTFTKILFATEDWDTNNNFASSTFTPTIAGYYQINATISLSSVSNQEILISIYKNGSEHKRAGDIVTTTGLQVSVSSLVYCNGSTDYIDIYGYQNSGVSKTTATNAWQTWTNGFLARGA